MAKAALPRVHVLVICDEIEERFDEVEGFNLLFVRSHILAPAFPYLHPQLIVYLQVTGHPRVTRCRSVLLRAETDEELYRTPEDAVELRGPLEFHHLHFSFPDCEFPEAGIYYVQVYFDDVLCGERALILLEEEPGRNGQRT
jgi:hypothetical protein